MDRRLWTVALAGATFAAVAGLSAAYQGGKPASPPAGPPSTGSVDFETKIGSFKILSPSSEVKALGKINMSFKGTVLLVGLEGSVIPGTGVKVQYEDAKRGRKVFYGQGSLAIDGKWRAIQFFGRDFKGSWTGMGIMRVYGEFDDKLETGSYTVKGFPKEAWGSGGRQVYLPAMQMPGKVKPKIEDVKPGG